MFRTASFAWSFAMALTLLGLPLLNNSLSLRADDRNDEPKEHTKDSLDKIQELVTEKKAVLVDVRELVEWNDGHVKEAVLLPWRELQDKLKEDDVREKVPKDMIVYTYCAVGYRSLRAAKILKKYGYDVRPLKPGFDQLAKAGFPTEKTKK
jgi:phage shock protein E